MKLPINKPIIQLLNLSLILVVLIAPACNGKKGTLEGGPNAYYSRMEKIGNHDVVVCDISKITRKVKFPISKLVDNCEMIYLETPDSSKLPELRRYDVSENYICVAGEGKPVGLFRRDGSFISDIGQIGRGPGEYRSTPYQIILEEKSNSIFLTPPFGVNKILHYDLEGNFVEAIPLQYESPKARIRIEGDIMTIMSMVFDDKTPIVYQQSLDGELIQQLQIIKNLIPKPDYNNEIISVFNTKSYDFQIVSEDTLFHYNAKHNTLEPQLTFLPFPNSTKPILTEFPDYYYATGYLKRSDDKYERWDVIINRKTLETRFCEVVDDFYGGITHSLLGCSNGWFVASKPAFKLIDEINQILKEKKTDIQARLKLENIVSRLHENDNDVLFVGKLK